MITTRRESCLREKDRWRQSDSEETEGKRWSWGIVKTKTYMLQILIYWIRHETRTRPLLSWLINQLTIKNNTNTLVKKRKGSAWKLNEWYTNNAWSTDSAQHISDHCGYYRSCWITKCQQHFCFFSSYPNEIVTVAIKIQILSLRYPYWQHLPSDIYLLQVLDQGSFALLHYGATIKSINNLPHA